MSLPGRYLARSCSNEQIRLTAGKCNLCRDDHRNQTIQERLASVRGAGVEPVFLSQEQAIDYAIAVSCFRSGEIRILDSSGAVTRTIPFSEADRKL